MTQLKTPITYYGGKQQMLREILPMLPPHSVYVEPFFGGGAVFWSKPPSAVEVINDINNRLICFYKVLKYDFEQLREMIDETFHSREQHRLSLVEYRSDLTEDGGVPNPLLMAWSVWMQTNMSFSSMIGAGFAYDRFGKVALKVSNKKNAFSDAYQERLKRVTIESYDVLKVLKAYDSEDAFFYLDPPYVSANQGHYAGYTEEDFRALLDACASMKGKFLLSSYPEEILNEYVERYGWQHRRVEKTLAVDGRRKENKVKTECLTWNY